jgi:hypothetical protein
MILHDLKGEKERSGGLGCSSLSLLPRCYPAIARSQESGPGSEYDTIEPG